MTILLKRLHGYDLEAEPHTGRGFSVTCALFEQSIFLEWNAMRRVIAKDRGHAITLAIATVPVASGLQRSAARRRELQTYVSESLDFFGDLIRRSRLLICGLGVRFPPAHRIAWRFW